MAKSSYQVHLSEGGAPRRLVDLWVTIEPWMATAGRRLNIAEVKSDRTTNTHGLHEIVVESVGSDNHGLLLVVRRA